MTDLFPEVVACEDNDKRYSTHELMAHAERITGVPHDGWDLDVAADAESHWAPRWYSAVEQPGSAGVDGLQQPWFTRWQSEIDHANAAHCEVRNWNVWANVPFSDIGAWVVKAWDEFSIARVGIEDRPLTCPVPLICMVVPSDRSDKTWWQDHIEPFRDGRHWLKPSRIGLTTHHLPSRIRYGHPGNPTAKGVGQPMFGTTLLVWRR